MTMTAGAEGVNVELIGALPKITINGTALSAEETAMILGLEIETAVGRPDLCELRFMQPMDQQGTPADDIKAGWAPGKTLKVEWGTSVVFDGEVTSVDYEGSSGSSTEVVLLAFDKRHRMYRTDQIKVFKDASFKDVVGGLLGEVNVQHDLSGLPADVMKYYLHEGTVGDLIERLCDQYGLYSVFKQGKVLVKKSSELTDDGGTLRATAELLDFRFRQTTSADRSKAQVRGWDPKQKKGILGDGARAGALPGGGLVESLDSKTVFGEQTLQHTTFVSSENEAKARALGALTRNVDAGIQFDGTALFSPKLTAGAVVKVEDVPKRFAGKYRLTSVRHRYDHEDGARSTITCRGADDTTLTGLLGQAVLGGAPSGARSMGHGLRPAIVANVKSVTGEGALGADGAVGEVKVKLPWLGDEIESGWLRVLTVGGGKDRGLFVMPEKGDEVLVAFQDGDTRSGYVLGGLYNGLDPAPRKGAKLTDGEKIHERVWRSRKGHEIAMGDKDGEEFILLKSADTAYMIVIDLKEKAIRIESDGNVAITAEKDLSIEAKGEITIKATKDLKLEGQNVKIDGKANVDVKATANATVEGTGGAAVKGAKVDINSQGPATVKGNPIMLN